MQKIITGLIAFSLACLVVSESANACTRVVYKGPEQSILTGRTMDFSIDIPANLWIFPRGMERSGEVGATHSLGCRAMAVWRQALGTLPRPMA